ncbi:hypothetical protein VIGAN_04322900 [Vigna angularis var. angularis]|uniref:Uncharacterized protein n=1 Tax=Vigna angularis var. angularis TaxID=157739 RepID=A0A0S3RYJ2_PHAAN|nr:hypothetical protein VIGAN_04322900 [Vigna angularis var. angularis]
MQSHMNLMIKQTSRAFSGSRSPLLALPCHAKIKSESHYALQAFLLFASHSLVVTAPSN